MGRRTRGPASCSPAAAFFWWRTTSSTCRSHRDCLEGLVSGSPVNLIDEEDSDAFELIEKTKGMLGPNGISGNIRKLESQIYEYEYEDAGRTLYRVLKELNVKNDSL